MYLITLLFLFGGINTVNLTLCNSIHYDFLRKCSLLMELQQRCDTKFLDKFVSLEFTFNYQPTVHFSLTFDPITFYSISNNCLRSIISIHVLRSGNAKNNTQSSQNVRNTLFRRTYGKNIVVEGASYACNFYSIRNFYDDLRYVHRSTQLTYSLCIPGGFVTHVQAIVRGTAQLPCDLTPPAPNDSVVLVVWYKDEHTPIYRYVCR